VAHVGLALAFLMLAIDPTRPGAFFLHPMVAVVHLRASASGSRTRCCV